MKKTLTITTVRAINYGAVLQAYALHKKILMLGAENELIYLKNEKPNYFQSLRKYNFRIKCIKLLENYFRIYRYFSCKSCFNKFVKFSEENFKHTKEIMSLNDIELNKYDAIITGSDQMFGFGVDKNINMARFLCFDDKNKIKRYSFAASFSSYNLDKKQNEFMKKQLKKFEKISVREEQGKSFLKNALSIESQVNIDPVFLLEQEEWEKIITNKRIIKEKYILCYFLISSPILEQVIKKLKEKYNDCKVISVQLTSLKRIKADKYIFDAGPKEFLNLIKNAEAVVTTSFHGTAFSLIFKKDFYSVLKKGYRTERFESLLGKVDLKERLLIEDVKIENILPINYDIVFKKLKEEKRKSIEYIKEILNNK